MAECKVFTLHVTEVAHDRTKAKASGRITFLTRGSCGSPYMLGKAKHCSLKAAGDRSNNLCQGYLSLACSVMRPGDKGLQYASLDKNKTFQESENQLLKLIFLDRIIACDQVFKFSHQTLRTPHLSTRRRGLPVTSARLRWKYSVAFFQ